MRTIKFSLLALCAVFVLSLNDQTASAASQCVSIPADLSYGMTDYPASGFVTNLQQYLSSARYLAVAPNGHFGPATVAAVKSFQSVNGISNTGYVGPLTRATLARLTCAGSPSTAQPVQSVQPAQSQPTMPNTSAVSAVPASVFTAPLSGQVLTEGQSFNITWNIQPYARYDIVLLSPSGAVGFIAQSVGSVDQYLWNAGTVFTSQTQSNITVPAGSYQIRIQNSATGAEPTDPISAPFTLAAATLTLSSVSPASVSADGITAAVLYGSDFNSGITVNFSGTSAKGQVLFASSDGKVLVFSIPLSTPVGSESVYVTNSAGQTSNQLSFTIINP